MPTCRLTIKGKVQGVSYRLTAKRIAVEVGVTGWIKNKTSGDVEAKVTGTSESINAFIDWCRLGPERSIVKEIIVKEEQEEIFSSFLVKR